MIHGSLLLFLSLLQLLPHVSVCLSSLPGLMGEHLVSEVKEIEALSNLILLKG